MIKHLLFDWGDTLMVDNPALASPMVEWDSVNACDGVSETLPKLAAILPCSVVSNASQSDGLMMKKAFERVNLTSFLTHFLTPNEINAHKPSPEFFINAAGLVGVNPTECCMIGNRYESDIVGAKQAGMKTVLITKQKGDFPKTDYVIEDFSKLAEIFEKCSPPPSATMQRLRADSTQIP
jgi:putative hydrolase of the HAD superfamily